MQVRWREQGPVWSVTLAPGGADRTLIDSQGLAALRSGLDRALARAARVIVIEGSAAGFCEGLDLGALLERGGDPAPQLRAFADCLRLLREGRALVIAAVDGVCAGGGVGLAASADLLLCTARSSFALPELVLGILPALVMPALLERLAPQKARLLALGGSIDGARALHLGLADLCVGEPAELQRAQRSLVKQALRSHPGAVHELKRLGASMVGRGFAENLAQGVRRSAELLGDPERLAGVRAFLEGELPPWFERQGGDREENR